MLGSNTRNWLGAFPKDDDDDDDDYTAAIYIIIPVCGPKGSFPVGDHPIQLPRRHPRRSRIRGLAEEEVPLLLLLPRVLKWTGRWLAFDQGTLIRVLGLTGRHG